MNPWANVLVSKRSPWPYMAGAVVSLVLAVVGYATYLPNAGVFDVAFHSLNLLTLNFRVVEGVAVPWTLQLARFLVHLVAGAALGVTVSTLLRRGNDRRRARGWGEHVVVLGSGETAVDLATAYRDTTKKVVLVGSVTEDDQERLHNFGVSVVTAPDDKTLGDIVEGASRVIVAGNGDQDTVRLATRLSASGQPVRYTHLLVQHPELAGELRHLFPHRVDVCCVAERIGSAVLQEFPPRHEDTLGPGPVVIGQGDLAVELARRMVRGWYRPADPMRVMCLGPQPTDFIDLREELASVGRIEVGSGPWNTRAAVEQVVAHAVEQRPPDRDLERRGEHGPLVVLAGLDDEITYTLATRIAGKVAGATVVALVNHDADWARLARGSSVDRRATGASLVVRPARSTVTRPDVLETDRVSLLAHELFADQRRWRDDVPSVFGADVRAAADFKALSDAQRERFQAVAAAVPDAFDLAGLRIESTDRSQVVLLPDELVGISEQLRRAASHVVGREHDEYLWLEFVAQLPMLASRAGMDLERSVVPEVQITGADLEAMARAAHENYVDTQAAVGNLTGSALAELRWEQLTEFAKESNRAQVRDIPVKLAGVGRTLCHLGDDGPDRSWLTDEAVQRLAVWEHRRWEYLHRLAGYTYAEVTDHAARQHSMLVPWEEVAEAKTLDASVVTSIPELLAGVGLDTRPIDLSSRDARATSFVAN